MERQIFAGVELGGTKCVCTLAASHEEVFDQVTVPTASPEHTLVAIEAVLREWQSREPIAALGIASFGPIDLDRSSETWGFITMTTKPDWPGTNVAGRLQRLLGVPVGFDTDVNGAALAEQKWGSAQGESDLAYITIGTGVGVGLIVNGRPVHGFAHPELGHLRVVRLPGDEWGGCCSFHGDCVEGLVSGPALEARFGERSVGEVPAEDPEWEPVAWTIAQLCHALVLSVAPKAILIGGGVAQGQPHLLPRVLHMLEASLVDYVRLPSDNYVRSPGLGAMAGPLGAIALAMDASAA